MPDTAIAQAPASLLSDKEKPPPPAPQLVTGQSTTPAPASEAFSEEWVKAFVAYIGTTAYEATGYEEMRFSSFELAMLTAPLTKFLNRTAPAMAARAFPGLVDEDDPTPVILAAVILLIGIRRILAFRRRRREEREKKGATRAQRPAAADAPPAPPAQPDLRVMGPEPSAGAVAPESAPPATGMTGEMTGGFVGNGRLR
ncbi:MAG TPA: hypothetical protein VFC09_09730 [Candidatus Dormibacteraeota bacterium]|nr:hypothetical protein [Candidatus Dormibacteraeota bacterium]